MTRTGTALALLAAGVLVTTAGAAPPQRVTVTGEVIDSWCYISEVMFGLGTAHHQCAIWCAAGGVPVGILGDDGHVYVVLKVNGNTTNVANPTLLRIQSHQVTAEGDLYERDGVKYLLISRVADDKGVVNFTHDTWPIQPFGE